MSNSWKDKKNIKFSFSTGNIMQKCAQVHYFMQVAYPEQHYFRKPDPDQNQNLGGADAQKQAMEGCERSKWRSLVGLHTICSRIASL
jgi:hypothetical protein